MKNILIKTIVLFILTGCNNKCKECPVYVYEGTVLNGNTLQPLPGCGVSMANSDSKSTLGKSSTIYTTTTDVNGKYKFEFDCKTAMSKNLIRVIPPSGSVGYYCSEFNSGINDWLQLPVKQSTVKDFYFKNSFDVVIKYVDLNELNYETVYTILRYKGKDKEHFEWIKFNLFNKIEKTIVTTYYHEIGVMASDDSVSMANAFNGKPNNNYKVYTNNNLSSNPGADTIYVEY